MSLIEQLHPLATKSHNRAGKLLANQRMVSLLDVSAAGCSGVVHEDYLRRHSAVLMLEGDRIIGTDCTCENRQPCAHVIALAWTFQQEYREYAAPGVRTPPLPQWLCHLRTMQAWSMPRPPAAARDVAGDDLLYIVDLPRTQASGDLCLRLAMRRTTRSRVRIRLRTIAQLAVPSLADARDRAIVAMIKSISEEQVGAWDRYSPVVVPSGLYGDLLPPMSATGRLMMLTQGEDENDREYEDELDPADLRPVQWDAGPPWELHLCAVRVDEQNVYRLSGELRRAGQSMDLKAPLMLLATGLLFTEERIALTTGEGWEWIATLRRRGEIVVPFADASRMLQELLRLPRLPPLDLPAELKLQEHRPVPKPRVKVRAARADEAARNRLRLEVSFDYEGRWADLFDPAPEFFADLEQRRIVRRDPAAEAAACRRLLELGAQEAHGRNGAELRLVPARLPALVRTLLAEGWQVEAEGRLFRRPGRLVGLEVTSGIDWFELHGRVDFEGQSIPLPAVLAALARKQDTVVLDDGSLGMIPEQWLRKYALLAGMGQVHGEHLRFTRAQASVLDALLAAEEEVRVDEVFARMRRELAGFCGIQPLDAVGRFTGTLRPYQRDALGWFEFLRKFGFGGCLADDMGLGKTVQVLALLESRRQQSAGAEGQRPVSLIVVPRSLVFNWKQEAAHFTPELRILDFSQPQRDRSAAFRDCDVVLATYGTLVRDVETLRNFVFDYVILDEAQAIKNGATDSAKAARLLKGRHRLALSGTPIQNHLGELWSLLDFLNPGLPGAASAFTSLVGRCPDEDARAQLSRAVRPFILRRTKEQVAGDLPPRIEQTLYCELDADQRQLYDQLRDHYRCSLLQKLDADSMNKAKIEILEALLRLRQAAIHPGLIDKSRCSSSSAKLDTLMPRLQELIEEGHKTLVFSQFTSMLAIVADRLRQQRIPFAYLDGQTRDRQQRVEQFQNDPDCPLFLISLKAGGLGLNLTAADYVFLLDPWWNPAVEAQAIDRAHRIGQTRHVYACRIIARDTVEEKVLTLQQNKRALADAIINADNSLIRTISREDLEMLLS
jgi:superfamily II DNA or RNA helicase